MQGLRKAIFLFQWWQRHLVPGWLLMPQTAHLQEHPQEAYLEPKLQLPESVTESLSLMTLRQRQMRMWQRSLERWALQLLLDKVFTVLYSDLCVLNSWWGGSRYIRITWISDPALIINHTCNWHKSKRSWCTWVAKNSSLVSSTLFHFHPKPSHCIQTCTQTLTNESQGIKSLEFQVP